MHSGSRNGPTRDRFSALGRKINHQNPRVSRETNISIRNSLQEAIQPSADGSAPYNRRKSIQLHDGPAFLRSGGGNGTSSSGSTVIAGKKKRARGGSLFRGFSGLIALLNLSHCAVVGPMGHIPCTVDTVLRSGITGRDMEDR
jgi:hypothetical protein